MEVKKKAHLQLERNSGLYFAIGMTLVLALIYAALEWKTYEPDNEFLLGKLNIPEEIEDDIPPLVQFTQPPPPPVPPTSIEIAPDTPEIIESVINFPDPEPTTEIPEIVESNFTEPEVEEVIPFILIEEVPVFPGCENADDKRRCFSEMMQEHVRHNFNYPERAIDLSLQGRVYVQFTVQKDGSIGDVKLRGPHKLLEEEAARIISKMPMLIPGKQRGKAVKVPFGIPIIFAIQ